MIGAVLSRVLSACAAVALTLFVSVSSHAVEPAGGPPDPMNEEDASVADDSTDEGTGTGAAQPGSTGTSETQRNWLLRGSSARPGTEGKSPAGFSLGALVIVLGLGGAAIAMYLKRRKKLVPPLVASEARLTVLSSSRIGPKAFAVSAHVGGRVMLLGVTDHTVTHLGWLDRPEDEAMDAHEEAEDATEDTVDSDGLPSDYPGSALRNPPARTIPLASSDDLRRFQEVLRGVQSRAPGPRPSLPPNAASTLAAQTTDVVLGSRAPAGPRASMAAPAPALLAASPPASSQSTAPASLRRKRQRRQDSLPPQKPAQPKAKDDKLAKMSEAGAAGGQSFEGQVAGLRALRNG
jgi:flagellar biogenesis protein FliO